MKLIKRAAAVAAKTARKDGVYGRLSSGAIYATKKGAAHVLSDAAFVRLYHRMHVGRWPRIEKPETFNEKLQWLKLYYRPDQLPDLVDKWAVREFVASRIGADALIKVQGIFDSADEVNFDALGQQFVLKPTHGSGWVIVCRDKDALDRDATRAKLRRWQDRNYYYHAREWAYRTVRPRIICEDLLLDEAGSIPMDYKFFCFDGEPQFIQVDSDRFTSHVRDFYSTEWARMGMEMLYPSSGRDIAPPKQLAAMRQAARALSADFPFCRVDFYEVGAKFYFGELTFFPENGVGEFRPQQLDLEVGKLLRLPPR